MKTLKDTLNEEYINARQKLLKTYSEKEIQDMTAPIIEKTLSQIKIRELVQKTVHDN